MRKLPGKRVKRTLAERTALRAADPTLPACGTASVLKYYDAVSSFIKFCWRKRWLKHQICADVRIKPKHKPAKSEKVLAYTAEQSRLIFDALPRLLDFAKPRDLDMRWHILLQMFTGCRPEESAQLMCGDVAEFNGVWVIDINELSDGTVKTQAGVRQVPVHPGLQQLGFLDFVHSRRTAEGARLFVTFKRPQRKNGEEGSYLNASVGSRIRRFIRGKLGITNGRYRPQYSFRHRFHDAMRNASVPLDSQYQLVGHEDDNRIHGGYGDGAALKVLAGWVAKIDPLADPA